jgi:hypothetical protein
VGERALPSPTRGIDEFVGPPHDVAAVPVSGWISRIVLPT